MTDLRQAAKQALEEWRTEPGSVRMASLMMALERAIANDAMDKMAENARELGLDYEPRDEAFKNFAKAVREYADEQRELAEDSKIGRAHV